MVSRELSLPRLTLAEFNVQRTSIRPIRSSLLSLSTNQERNQASGGWVFARFLTLGAGCMLLSPSPDWSIVFFALTAILLVLV